MTDEEYEDLYREALRCLAERFSVGGAIYNIRWHQALQSRRPSDG